MINQPPIENLLKKTESNYELCCVVAKRARLLIEQETAGVINDEEILKYKPITYAAKELEADKISIQK